MYSDSINILLPLLLMIGGGFLLARLFSLSEGSLVRVITDFFMPLLVFHSFCTTTISPKQIFSMAGIVSLVIFLLFVICWSYCRVFKIDIKAFAPPILFMNSGFLGIPIMKLWGGAAAMNLVVIYDQIQTFFIFSLGIILVTGGYRLSGLKEILRTPLIWAIISGVGVSLYDLQLDPAILNAIKFGGDVAPPLAVFSIGVMLSRYKIKIDRHVLMGVFIRACFGFVFGLIASIVFGLSGTAATVVMVTSALPSAVFSVVLPVRYGVNGQYASSILIISTLLLFLTLPLTFYLSEQLY